MELLLNIAWLLIGGVALWMFLGTAPMDRKRFLFALVALGCAILLLFPAVSASDDLHFQAFVSEDANASKRLLNAAAHNAPLGFCAILTMAVLLAAPRRTVWLVRGVKSVPVPTALIDLPILGRAPPSADLA